VLKNRSLVICGNGEVDGVRNLRGHPIKCESLNQTQLPKSGILRANLG
jgi:hypothetical protein